MQEDQDIQEQIQDEDPTSNEVVNSVDYNWKQAQEVMSMQKREIEALKQQMTQLSQKPEPEERDVFEDLDPEDYMTVGRMKELSKTMVAKQAKAEAQKLINEYAQTQQIAIDEQRMRAKHEDYDYVVENYALEMIKSDPALAYKIQTSKNPAEAAYRLGKMSDRYDSSKGANVSPRAEKILKNNARPVSSHSGQTTLKSQSDMYSKMSPADIWAESQNYAKRA